MARLLSLLEKANRHKRTMLDPRAALDQANEDVLQGIGRQQFVDQHIRDREAARGANDVLRGSGMGGFFDALDTKEAEAAYDGKSLKVGPIYDDTFTGARGRGGRRQGLLDRLQTPQTQRLVAGRGTATGGGSGDGIIVHGPRRNPDLPMYAPADFQDMSAGGGVSSRGVRGATVANAARPQDASLLDAWRSPESTGNLAEDIRGRRVGNERRDVLEGAETEAAKAFVPSAIRGREETNAIRRLIEEIKARAQVDEATVRGNATRDAARIRSTERPAPDALDRADLFNEFSKSGIFPKGQRPKDERLGQLYDLLLKDAQPSVPGADGMDDPETEALIDQMIDQGMTDEEIETALSTLAAGGSAGGGWAGIGGGR